MAHLKIEPDGSVRLPEKLLQNYRLSPGAELIVESIEDG